MDTASLTPLKTGYYKFLSLQGNKAEAEYKDKLTANIKTVCIIDTTPLFDSRSKRPDVNTLTRKLISINSIVLNETGNVDYCVWEILTLAELEIKKAKELNLREPTRIHTTQLTMWEALKLYDQIKANPENLLPDALEEQYAIDDYNSDDYETEEASENEV